MDSSNYVESRNQNLFCHDSRSRPNIETSSWNQGSVSYASTQISKQQVRNKVHSTTNPLANPLGPPARSFVLSKYCSYNDGIIRAHYGNNDDETVSLMLVFSGLQLSFKVTRHNSYHTGKKESERIYTFFFFFFLFN